MHGGVVHPQARLAFFVPLTCTSLISLLLFFLFLLSSSSSSFLTFPLHIFFLTLVFIITALDLSCMKGHAEDEGRDHARNCICFYRICLSLRLHFVVFFSYMLYFYLLLILFFMFFAFFIFISLYLFVLLLLFSFLLSLCFLFLFLHPSLSPIFLFS